MKQKFVKRVVALALSFTLALAVFVPVAVSADEAVVYQLATDAHIQSLSVGTSGPGTDIFGTTGDRLTDYLQGVGPSTYTIVASPEGGNGIRISGRADSWQGLDIRVGDSLGHGGMRLSDAQYTIRVRGTTTGSGTFQLAGADAPHSGFFGEDVSGDFSIEHTFTLAGIEANGVHTRGHMRINTTGGFTQDLVIHEIVIARGTSIPANLPTLAAAGADTPAADTPPAEVVADETETEVVADDTPPAVETEVVADDTPPAADTPPLAIVTPASIEIRLELGSTTATVNGVAETLEYAPFIADDRTMVPVRFIAEALGGTLSFDQATRTVTINRDGDTLQLVIDEPLPGGMGTPVIREGRTFVPARFVVEELGATITAALPVVTINA
jgi:hypothetical protein